MFRRILSITIALSSVGCAVNTKKFSSEVEIDGRNYLQVGKKGDQGGFYIDDDPLIRLRLGCRETTVLGSKLSLLLPIPILEENKVRHDSISNNEFKFKMRREGQPYISKDEEAQYVRGIIATIKLEGKEYFLKPQKERGEWVEFSSSLRCGDLKNARMNFQLPNRSSRKYILNFEEKVNSDMSYLKYWGH